MEEDEDKTIYDDDTGEEMSEDDIIDPAENGFMKGYNEEDERDEEESDEEDEENKEIDEKDEDKSEDKEDDYDW